MSVRLFLYCIILPLTIWALEALDLNRFFKKGRIVQAQILYFFLSLAMTYLIVNALFDVFASSKIV